jgi:hypothetical protein
MKKDDDRFTENMALLIAMLIALLVGLGVAGNGDLEEAEKQAKVYNDMVCAGHWPDYENRKPKCN